MPDLKFIPETYNTEDDNKPTNNIFGATYSPSIFNPNKYNSNKTLSNFSLDPTYQPALDETRARNQSVPSLIGKSAVQSLTSTVGMFVQSFDALTNPQAIFSKEREDGVLSIIGDAITKAGQDAAPIYLTKKAQDGFSPSDATWLATGVPSVFSSVAMMLPALGVTKGVGLLGEGLSKLNNVSKVLGATGRTLETAANSQFGASVITGIAGRHIDSYLSSAQTYKDLYENGITLGMNPEEAHNYAGEGARKAYQLGMLNTAFDIAEWNILLKGTSFLNRNLKPLAKAEQEALLNEVGTGESKNVINNILSNTIQQTIEKPEKWYHAISDYAKVAGLEAADEMTMDVAQNEGRYYVDHKYGIDKSQNSFADRLADSITQSNTLQDGFWGAIGGLAMEAVLGAKGLNLATKKLFAKHYDNEENRIKDFIERNNQLRTKVKTIQDLQSNDNNYEAEQIHNSIINDIVSSGIKNGTMNLDLKFLENLSKIGFKNLTEEQKEQLNNDGFNEKSPEIAKSLYDKVKTTKEIFDKHFNKDYTIGTTISDSSIPKESVRNYMSSLAGDFESDIISRDNIIKKANIQKEELEKFTTKNTNGRDNPSVQSYVNAISNNKAAQINLDNINSQIQTRNKTIDLAKQQLFNLKNIATIESQQTGKSVSIDSLSEQILHNTISAHTEAIKILENKKPYFKEILTNTENEIKKHNENIQNFKDNQSNINTEGYTKKPTTYSQNTIDEIEKTINDKEYLDNVSNLAVLQKQIHSLEHDQTIASDRFNKFTKDVKYREEYINKAIEDNKKQTEDRRNDFKTMYDSININDENIDSTINQVNQFIDLAKKEPLVSDMLKQAQDQIVKLEKRKQEVVNNKTKQDKSTENKQQDTDKHPKENKDIFDSVSIDDLQTDLKIPFSKIEDDSIINPEHTNPSTESNSRIERYSFIPTRERKNLSITQEQQEAHNILSEIDKELNNNFVIDKNEAKIRNNKSKENINISIDKLNNLKNTYLKLVKQYNLNDEAYKELNQGNPYLDTTNDTKYPGASNILRDINKVNKLIYNINLNKAKQTDNKIILDFSPKFTTETVKNIADFIETKYQDESQRILKRNDIGKSITDLLTLTNPNDIELKKEEIKSKLSDIYNDSEIPLNIKFSKSLNEPINDINLNNKELDNRLSEVNFILDSRNLMSALRLYTNSIARGGNEDRGTLFKYITYQDLMLGLYRTNPDLIDPMYKSVNNALIMRSNVLNNKDYAITSGDSKILLSEIFESNPTKLYVNPSEIIKDTFLSKLKKQLEIITENNKYYTPIDGVYVTPISESEGKLNVTPNMQLQDSIPNHVNFANYIESINNLNNNSEIKLDVIGSGIDAQINIISNGTKIGEIAKPEFIFDGVVYSTKIGDNYVFRNPFAEITDEQYNIIEDLQDILRTIYYSKNKDFKFTETDLDLLKDGKYNLNKNTTEDEKSKQKTLYKIYLSFSGVSNSNKFNIATFRRLVTPLFIGENRNAQLRLTKSDIIKKINNHVDRFSNDFNRTMEIRNNPNGFTYSIERISTPDILHSEGVNSLVYEVIDNPKIGVIDLEHRENNTLYDPISGDRIHEVPNENRTQKNSQVLYLVLNAPGDKKIAHQVYVANIIENSIQNENYKNYANATKEFIKNEFIKLITTQPTDDYEYMLKNLNKLINVFKNGEFTHFKNTPDNLTFNIFLPFDINNTGIRNKKVKIAVNKNGKFRIQESDIISNDNIEKATIDTSKEARFNENFKDITTVDKFGNKISEFTEEELRDKLDYYISNMLRNFSYNKNKIDLSQFNDHIDNKDNSFYEPLDRYNEDGSLKSLNQRRKYDNSYGNPYLTYSITQGTFKTNIAAIKYNGRNLTNFNLGYNSEYPLSIHIKHEKIIGDNKPEIEKVTDTESLKKIESFKPYIELLEGLEPMKIEFLGNSPDDTTAMKTGSTIYSYQNTIKQLGLDLNRELAHEIIHAKLDQTLIKLDDVTRNKIANDIIKVRNVIEKAITTNEGLLSNLTDNERKDLSNFISTINTDDKNQIDLNTLQEIFAYPLTRPSIAAALSKIQYIGDVLHKDVNTTKSIWDKMLDLILNIIGVNNPSIMNNIISILNSFESLPESNISEQTRQQVNSINSEMTKNVQPSLANDNSTVTNVQGEVKRPLSNQAARLAGKKKSLILNSNSDYKVVNSQEFIEFNNANKDTDINENLEYFKKCYGIGNKAANGMNVSNFTKGNKWEIVKELKGNKHSQGGIDLVVDNGKVNILKGENKVKAKYGMIINK